MLPLLVLPLPASLFWRACLRGVAIIPSRQKTCRELIALGQAQPLDQLSDQQLLRVLDYMERLLSRQSRQLIHDVLPVWWAQQPHQLIRVAMVKPDLLPPVINVSVSQTPGVPSQTQRAVCVLLFNHVFEQTLKKVQLFEGQPLGEWNYFTGWGDEYVSYADAKSIIDLLGFLTPTPDLVYATRLEGLFDRLSQMYEKIHQGNRSAWPDEMDWMSAYIRQAKLRHTVVKRPIPTLPHVMGAL